MILRPYQQIAIDSIHTYWSTGKKCPVIVAPTGSGKSLIIAAFCQQTIEKAPNTRIMVVTDSRELIEQNAEELKRHWPDAPLGIYSSGLGKKQTHSQITFAGIQSVYKRINTFIPVIDIVIVDECHMIPKSSDTRYGKFIHAIRRYNPSVKIWGCSATPYRLDSGLLHHGDGALFDGIAYSVDMQELISDGYLTPVISKGGVKSIDLSNVHVVAGEYNAKELSNAASNSDLIRSATNEIKKFGKDRKSWLIFAAAVSHAYDIRAEIPDSEVITGNTPISDRDEIIDRFRSGKLKCLINVAVLIKGFNAPGIDLIALMTATKSTSRYVQMVGRGMRPYPRKENCLLLDFGNNVIEHGFLDDINPKTIGSLKKPTLKICPVCQTFTQFETLICPVCDNDYIEKEHVLNHEGTSYGGAVLTEQALPIWEPVESVEYKRNTSFDKTQTSDGCCIVYHTNSGRKYMKHLITNCGNFTTDSIKWIHAALGASLTVDQAIEEWDQWRKPNRIKIINRGSFWNVIGADYTTNTVTT